MSTDLNHLSKLQEIFRKKRENKQKAYEPVLVVEDISTDEFIERYENQNIPVIIKNFQLDWKAFEKWDRQFITEKLDLDVYRKYLKGFPQVSFRDKEVKYLSNLSIKDHTFLKEDYTIPPFFSEASYQPEEYQWIFLGPPSSMTNVHQDVEYSHAWNVSIYGLKYWWFFPDRDRALVGTAKPGDIVFTPGGMFHAVVNLEESLSVTHNYKR